MKTIRTERLEDAVFWVKQFSIKTILNFEESLVLSTEFYNFSRTYFFQLELEMTD